MGMKAVRLCAKRKGQIQEIFRMLIQQTILCLGKAKATEARNSEKKKKHILHRLNISSTLAILSLKSLRELDGQHWGSGGKKKMDSTGAQEQKTQASVRDLRITRAVTIAQ